MPPRSHGVFEPAATARAERGGRPSSARTSSSGRSACSNQSVARRSVLRPAVGVVDVVREHRPAVHGVGEAHRHAVDVAGEVAAVVLEEPLGRVEEVAGLEQAEHHRQQRERLGVVVAARDQAEDLDLGLDRRAVVGEHMDPVVLGEVRRRALGPAGEGEATRPVEAPHALAQRAVRAVLERRPLGVEGVVGVHACPTRRRAPATCAGARGVARAAPGSSRCARSR